MLLNEVFKRDDGRKLNGEGGMGIKEQYAPLVTLFRNVVKGQINHKLILLIISIVANRPSMSGTLPDFLSLYRKGTQWP